MAYCKNCGAKLDEDSKVCPSCGTEVPQSSAVIVRNTVDVMVPQESDVASNKGMAVLAYIGILVLVPVFAAGGSSFVRFHANQGLVLFLAEVAYAIVSSILTGILTTVLFAVGAWGLWGLLSTLLGLVWIVFVVLSIIGIVNVVNGRKQPLPLIGGVTLLK